MIYLCRDDSVYKKMTYYIYFRSHEPWQWGGMPWPTPLLIAASCWPDSSREEQPPMNTKYIVGVWVESYWKRIPTLTFSLREMVSTARPPLVWFSVISILPGPEFCQSPIQNKYDAVISLFFIFYKPGLHLPITSA